MRNTVLFVLGLSVLVSCLPPGTGVDGGSGVADAGDAGPQRPGPSVAACISNPQCDHPLVVGHRGYMARAPENTLVGIDEAVAAGADLVETDPHETADGVYINMHDDTADRTTDAEQRFPGRTALAQLTWAEVQQLVIDDEEGLCTEESADAMAERCRVPSMQQMIEAARGRCILMLDWKAGSVEAMGDLLLATDAVDSVILYDEDTRALTQVRGRVPGLVIMPRAYTNQEARDFMEGMEVAIVHVDSSILAGLDALAQRTETKLFASVFMDVDLFLFGWADSGDEANLTTATNKLQGILNGGVGVVQTNWVPEVRGLVDAWYAAR